MPVFFCDSLVSLIPHAVNLKSSQNTFSCFRLLIRRLIATRCNNFFPVTWISHSHTSECVHQSLILQFCNCPATEDLKYFFSYRPTLKC